ncbi:MAG: FHA domain-containing protein [Planctomycetes bacterium]|nr:FHA domain-containing protein [Planctomycetota bacterium]
MEKIILIEGGRPREFPLAGTLTIGRAPGNDLILSDRKASRHHARIEQIADAWYLTDLDSSNGTFLNGMRVTEESRLSPGDRIAIGDATLHFGEIRAEEEAPAPGMEPTPVPEPVPHRPSEPPRPAGAGDGAEDRADEAGEGAEEEEDLDIEVEPVQDEEVRPAPSDAPGSGAAAIFLEAKAGSLTGKRIPLAAFPFTVGRAPDSDLQLPDARTSHAHARLLREGPRVFVEDRGSTNGTWVNGEKVQRAELLPGDDLLIGASRFTYHGPGNPRPRPVEVSRPADAGFVSEDAFARVRVQEAPETPAAVAFGAIAAIIVVTVAILVLGFDVLQRFLNPPPVDPNAPENAIRRNFSFEADPHGAAPSGWTVGGPEGRKVWVDRERPAAAPGRAALVVEAPAGDAPVLVSQQVPVGASAAYVIRAAVRSHGALGATIAVTWLRRGEGETERIVRTDFAEAARDPGDPWDTFEDAQAVLAVPQGASDARVSCLVLGPGSASFDRVEFSAAEGSPPPALRLEGAAPLTLDLETDGSFQLSPERGAALSGIRFLVDPGTDGGLWGQRFGITVEPFGATEGGGARGVRRVLDRSRGAWVDVLEAIATAPGEIDVEWKVRPSGGGLPARVGLAFERGFRSEREPVVSYGEGGIARFSLGEIDGKTLQEFSIGEGAEQLTFAFNAPVTFRAVPRPDLPTVYVAAAATDALPAEAEARGLSVQWYRFSPREDRKVREILHRAEELAAVGESGGAIRVLQEIPARFPLRRSDVERAQKRIAELEATGEAVIAEIAQAGKDFEEFGSPLILESIRRRAAEMARRFSDHPLAEKVRKAAEAILVKQKLERRTGPDPRDLLAEGDRLFRLGRLGLADLYLASVERDFPGTPAAEKAQEMRNKIDGRLHGLTEKAFEEVGK